MSAFEENEISIKSQGGTEQCKRSIDALMPPGLTDDFQVICSRVRELKDDKIRVYWLHDLPEDPETSHLKNENSRNRFHKLVFCGNWQYNRYLDILGLTPNDNMVVIDTPVTPIDSSKIIKSNDEIRLVYTSTPQRGLSILVPVFVELAKKHKNIVLDVFSSFQIYGWGEADQQFEEVFKICREHPQINYHGFASNEMVRDTVAKAHIFAYPSIWMECNSRSLIEAMSAECLCVHPNLAGLSDTCGNMTAIYQWDADVNVHANKFYAILDNIITNKVFLDEGNRNYLKFIKMYADDRYHIKKIAAKWEALFLDLKTKYPTVESRKIPGEMFTYRV